MADEPTNDIEESVAQLSNAEIMVRVTRYTQTVGLAPLLCSFTSADSHGSLRVRENDKGVVELYCSGCRFKTTKIPSHVLSSRVDRVFRAQEFMRTGRITSLTSEVTAIEALDVEDVPLASHSQ